jgi:hypothetical protein
MALSAACVLDPGIYFAINSPAAVIGNTPERAAEMINSWGWVITPETITQTAADGGEHTILNRAGGAPTLAVVMAQAFGGVPAQIRWGFLRPHRPHCSITGQPVYSHASTLRFLLYGPKCGRELWTPYSATFPVHTWREPAPEICTGR